jgi:ribosomal-protein-alanine N-acetyltransferase
MDDDFRIRDATESDVGAIESIERASFPDPWSEESFQTLLAYPSFVAVDSEGQIAGYVFAVGVADAGEILNVAVSAEHRRRGLGRRLVEHALEALQGRGVIQIFLEVRESNAAARALYEALGFELIGRRRGYYRRPVEDALVLRWGGGRREE